MVRAFAEEGANVVIASRHEEEGEKLAEAIQGKAMSVSLDVTDEDSWRAAVAQIEKQTGPISVLVNKAAYLAIGGVETIHRPRIAKYVLFVAFDDAAFSTASEFVADGGFGLGPITA